ncbi:MAG: transglycosylase domain-containing protein, partial [Methylobacteriaceae bacterium]|nr:transglycosylase domain-containing protein [Methylobacteriaceae bacterium]
SRKIQEAILAFWLERNYSKDEILGFYLNRVYFGAGAYGIEAASLRYYNKPATELTLAEAAVMAGLVQSPARLAPNRNPAAAQERAKRVLAALRDTGLAPKRMIDEAEKNPAKAVRGNNSATANYAADYVMDILDDFVGTIDSDIYVFTTIDKRLQSLAENAVRSKLNEKGADYRVGQGALVSMTPVGAIQAIVGGRDYAESQYNRAVTARRQPGSAFKPFVYLTAVDMGSTPDDIWEDSPVRYGNWEPKNYSRTYFGDVTLRDALALSLNTVAVKLCAQVGPKNVVSTARRLGISSPLNANLSIALGTSEVTPLELTGAFSAFANGGYSIVPYIITQVSTVDNQLIYKRQGVRSFGQVISPSSLGMMNDMLNADFEAGTARSGKIPGWQAAGKTGTTQDWRDAWFVGFTSALVTGVWVGNDDNSPTRRASGGNLPLEIWSKYMTAALKDYTPAALPGGPFIRPEAQEQLVRGEVASARPATPAQAKKKGFFASLFGR